MARMVNPFSELTQVQAPLESDRPYHVKPLDTQPHSYHLEQESTDLLLLASSRLLEGTS